MRISHTRNLGAVQLDIGKCCDNRSLDKDTEVLSIQAGPPYGDSAGSAFLDQSTTFRVLRVEYHSAKVPQGRAEQSENSRGNRDTSSRRSLEGVLRRRGTRARETKRERRGGTMA